MSEAKSETVEIGKTGFWLAIIGAILILIDGIAVLATGHFYGPWHYGGKSVTGWTEIVLGIIILAIVPFYKRSPAGIGWTTFALAIIALPFDGGFYTIGAWIALIGGILMAFRK
jgi:peptidoglycan/LPS O-acetylase OafA/YrhL